MFLSAVNIDAGDLSPVWQIFTEASPIVALFALAFLVLGGFLVSVLLKCLSKQHDKALEKIATSKTESVELENNTLRTVIEEKQNTINSMQEVIDGLMAVIKEKQNQGKSTKGSRG